jgi:hypothetical protein
LTAIMNLHILNIISVISMFTFREKYLLENI